MFRSSLTALPRIASTSRPSFVVAARRTIYSTSTMSAQNQYGQGESHATGDSIVPESVQKAVPKAVEDALPNKIHDTGKSGSKSHATGDSVVPEGLQEAVPEGVEKAIPDAVHDTSKK